MYQEVAFNASYFVNLTPRERLVDFARFSVGVLSNLFAVIMCYLDILHQHVPHGDDVADAAGKDKEMEYGVHEALAV